MMELADPATNEHGRDVADLVARVGAMLGLDPAELEELELAARFHDVGKVAIPSAVLHKPGPLDETEWRVMQLHVEWGADLLMHLPDLERVAEIVRHHHERYDGSGYPDGLEGDEIPLASRIIAACDAWGAMVADRPYRAALGLRRAVRELEDGSGGQFDPAAVEAVVQLTTIDGERENRLAPT